MRKVVSKDSTAIAFDQIGKGPAVILVDGAMCYRASGPMGPLSKLLAPHFTVYTYDRRGRGDSSDTKPYAVEREIEDIEALITEAGGSAFVFGMSSGAALALEATRKLPAKIKKLALYEPPFMVAESDPRPPADHLEQLKEMIASNRGGDAVEYFMTKVVGMPAGAVAPMKESPMWQGLSAVAPTLVYDGTIMGDYSFPAKRDASITAPTLAMDGGASPAWAHNAAQAIADTLPNAQRRTLEGQTHDVAPDALAPVLVEFFKA